LDSNKNQTGALAVFAKAGINQSCLALVGGADEPGYEDRIREQADNLGIADRVIMTGGVDRAVAWAILRRTSVLLQTSRHEGFPQAPLEAQAMGVPVVAYRAGGFGDVVRHGETGYLVPVDDEGAAAQQLRLLILDDSTRMRLSMNASRWVRDRFDLADRLPDLFSLFDELCLAKRG
jgi:glycosyltransferase involved in cell wall biosynthesis